MDRGQSKTWLWGILLSLASLLVICGCGVALFARASRLVRAGHVQRAVHIVSAALTSAPQDNGGWLLPIEPLLRVGRDHQEWAPALAALHLRAR